MFAYVVPFAPSKLLPWLDLLRVWNHQQRLFLVKPKLWKKINIFNTRKVLTKNTYSNLVLGTDQQGFDISVGQIYCSLGKVSNQFWFPMQVDGQIQSHNAEKWKPSTIWESEINRVCQEHMYLMKTILAESLAGVTLHPFEIKALEVNATDSLQVNWLLSSSSGPILESKAY